MKLGHLYILITIVITSCLLTGCSRSYPIESIQSDADKTSINAAIADAAELFKDRSDLAKLRSAIRALARVRTADKRHFEIETHFAEYNYFLGLHSDDEKESEDAFTRGRDAGRIASRLEPSRPDGHFWYGANLGELSKRSPITVGLRSVDDIKEAMNRVIEIQPDFRGASAYDALGQVELATRIQGGNAATAVEFLEKGVELSKDNPNIRLHLAEAYLAVRRDSEAREQLNHLLRMAPNAEYRPEYEKALAAAKKLLSTKF